MPEFKGLTFYAGDFNSFCSLVRPGPAVCLGRARLRCPVWLYSDRKLGCVVPARQFFDNLSTLIGLTGALLYVVGGNPVRGAAMRGCVAHL